MSARAVVRVASATLLALAPACENVAARGRGALVSWAERHLVPEAEPDLAAALAGLSDAAAGALAGAPPRARERLSAIEGFVRQCAIECGAERGPRAVEAFCKVLFESLTIEPVTEGGEFRLMFPDFVLRARRGSCLGLAGLFLAASQRLGIKISGVLVPGHFLVRYDDSRERFNVELLRRGLRREDAFYRGHFGIPPDAAEYLRSLDARETLAVYLFNAANALREAGGDRGTVARLYEIVLGVLPGFAEARGNLGVLLLESGDSARAAAELERARAANPWLSGIHLDLCAARCALGDLDGAEAALRSGSGPEDSDARFLHALARLELARGREEEAVRLFSRAVELDPLFAPAHRDLAGLLSARGEGELARFHLSEAARIESARHGRAAGRRAIEPW